MARITTLAGFKTYIMSVLGNPVIQIEVSDDQYDRIIDDTVQVFQDLHTGEGNFQDFLGFTISAGVSAYSTVGWDLASTLDLSLSVGTDGINTLFSPTHQLLYRDWVTLGGYPGGPGGYGGRYSGMVLAGYEVAMQYLNDINDTFSIMYHTQFSDARQEILIYPTPAETGTGLLTVYKKETAANLYNNRLVKRLAVAEAKIQWGTNLDKYAMTLPHGGTINGANILQRGIEEKERVMEDIQAESEPLPFYIE
jgi:hypothetical protein